MVNQYPHKLFYLEDGEKAPVQDADGNWKVPETGAAKNSICREEPNGKGAIVKNLNGVDYVFASVIYLPLSNIKLSPGTSIVIQDENGEETLRADILRFKRGSFNIKIWV